MSNLNTTWSPTFLNCPRNINQQVANNHQPQTSPFPPIFSTCHALHHVAPEGPPASPENFHGPHRRLHSHRTASSPTHETNWNARRVGTVAHPRCAVSCFSHTQQHPSRTKPEPVRLSKHNRTRTIVLLHHRTGPRSLRNLAVSSRWLLVGLLERFNRRAAGAEKFICAFRSSVAQEQELEGFL